MNLFPRVNPLLTVCTLAALATGLLATGFLWLQFTRHSPARVHVVSGVFSRGECDHAIQAAETANAWTKRRHAHYPTDDVSLADVPALANVSHAIDSRVVPRLRRAFGVRPDLEISVGDLFLIRYSAVGQSGLAMHIDSSTLSFSVALSEADAYVGGGIEFDLLDAPISVHKGSMVRTRGVGQGTFGICALPGLSGYSSRMLCTKTLGGLECGSGSG